MTFLLDVTSAQTVHAYFALVTAGSTNTWLMDMYYTSVTGITNMSVRIDWESGSQGPTYGVAELENSSEYVVVTWPDVGPGSLETEQL